MNLICIRHPHYDGNGSPVLSCKSCCAIYITVVKEKNAAPLAPSAPATESEWLKKKRLEAEAAASAMHRKGNTGFNPFSI